MGCLLGVQFLQQRMELKLQQAVALAVGVLTF